MRVNNFQSKLLVKSIHLSSFFSLQLVNRIILTISVIGNNGILSGTTLKRLISDKLLISHFICLGICVLGLFVHEFFYSVLVSFGVCTSLLLKGNEILIGMKMNAWVNLLIAGEIYLYKVVLCALWSSFFFLFLCTVVW